MVNVNDSSFELAPLIGIARENSNYPRVFKMTGEEIKALLQKQIDSLPPAIARYEDWSPRVPSSLTIIHKHMLDVLRATQEALTWLRDHVADGTHMLTPPEMMALQQSGKPHPTAAINTFDEYIHSITKAVPPDIADLMSMLHKIKR